VHKERDPFAFVLCLAVLWRRQVSIDELFEQRLKTGRRHTHHLGRLLKDTDTRRHIFFVRGNLSVDNTETRALLQQFEVVDVEIREAHMTLSYRLSRRDGEQRVANLDLKHFAHLTGRLLVVPNRFTREHVARPVVLHVFVTILLDVEHEHRIPLYDNEIDQ